MYTSGVWTADYSTALDNVTNAWLPDTYLLYGDDLYNYNLCDTRYLRHEHRFMLTHNKLDPKVYAVTKVQDLVPQGIIKLTLKQDELDEVRDNVDLMLCNYYNNSGEIITGEQSDIRDTEVFLWSAQVNNEGELEYNLEINYILHIAQTSYYNCEFFTKGKLENIPSEWRIKYIGTSNLTEKEKDHLCNLIVIRQINNSTISIRPSKTRKLIGERFKLTVQDITGTHAMSIEVEVQE